MLSYTRNTHPLDTPFASSSDFYFLQVVTALTTVKATVDGFLNSYIRHTNALLGIKTDTALGSLDVTAGLLGSTPTPAAPEAKKERKKREKKIRDPNAPKRPLTAFFLFTANARGLIREDLREAGTGEEPKGGAIAKEAERRWAELPEDEKEVWVLRREMEASLS